MVGNSYNPSFDLCFNWSFLKKMIRISLFWEFLTFLWHVPGLVDHKKHFFTTSNIVCVSVIQVMVILGASGLLHVMKTFHPLHFLKKLGGNTDSLKVPLQLCHYCPTKNTHSFTVWRFPKTKIFLVHLKSSLHVAPVLVFFFWVIFTAVKCQPVLNLTQTVRIYTQTSRIPQRNQIILSSLRIFNKFIKNKHHHM